MTRDDLLDTPWTCLLPSRKRSAKNPIVGKRAVRRFPSCWPSCNHRNATLIDLVAGAAMSEELTRSQTRVLGFPDGELDFQLLRQLGSVSYGGASVGEGLWAAVQIRDLVWNPGL